MSVICFHKPEEENGFLSGKEKNVVAEKNYHISQAYIFSNANLSVKGNFTYMPVYMLMFMKKTKPTNMIYKIDFL